ATDGAGGGIVCWQDSRGVATGTANDIYAARIYANGTTDVFTPRPEATALAQNYPNPFNPSTMIRYVLPEPSAVDLRIYDVSGRLVRELVRELALIAGRHEATWNGLDDAGQTVAAGVYFYQLEAGAFSETRCMTLVK
ncbi:MAG: FlgD immunoglobulin-like domain containing protein, partial [bacterium]